MLPKASLVFSRKGNTSLAMRRGHNLFTQRNFKGVLMPNMPLISHLIPYEKLAKRSLQFFCIQS